MGPTASAPFFYGWLRDEVRMTFQPVPKIEKFEDLEVWRQAHDMVVEVYRATRSLPDDERFGLTSQMRRAAVSVPANIVEGFKRHGRQDKIHFYNIAQSSLEEIRYYVILCNDLGYRLCDNTLSHRFQCIGRLLTGLVQATRR